MLSSLSHQALKQRSRAFRSPRNAHNQISGAVEMASSLMVPLIG